MRIPIGIVDVRSCRFWIRDLLLDEEDIQKLALRGIQFPDRDMLEQFAGDLSAEYFSFIGETPNYFHFSCCGETQVYVLITLGKSASSFPS